MSDGKKIKRDHGEVRIARVIGGGIDTTQLKVGKAVYATTQRARQALKGQPEGMYQIVRLVGPVQVVATEEVLVVREASE